MRGILVSSILLLGISIVTSQDTDGFNVKAHNVSFAERRENLTQISLLDFLYSKLSPLTNIHENDINNDDETITNTLPPLTSADTLINMTDAPLNATKPTLMIQKSPLVKTEAPMISEEVPEETIEATVVPSRNQSKAEKVPLETVEATEIPSRNRRKAIDRISTNDTSELYGCSTEYGPWWTPDYCRRYLLHWSATLGSIPLAQTLLESGRDINLQHNVYRTALHIGAHWGRAEYVRFLLRRGADPKLLDMWDHTAIELAEYKKCEDKTYAKTWKLSCTGAESDYPTTLAILKAGCEMTSCVYPYHCVHKECILY